MSLLDILEKNEKNILKSVSKKNNIDEEELLFWFAMINNSLLLYDYAIRYKSIYFSYLDISKVKKEISQKTGMEIYSPVLIDQCVDFFKSNIINAKEIIKIKSKLKIFLNTPAKLLNLNRFYSDFKIEKNTKNIYNYDLIIQYYLKSYFG